MTARMDDCILVVTPEIYDKEKGFEAVVIYRGINEAFHTDYFVGHDFDLAQEHIREFNLAHGHDMNFVTGVMETVANLDRFDFFNA